MEKNSLAQTLHLYLSLEQSRLLLEALVERPFKDVFEIIGSLNQQAQQFYGEGVDKSQAQLFILEKQDFSLCVKALGELPYNRVCALIHSMHQQLNTQLMQATETNVMDAGHTP